MNVLKHIEKLPLNWQSMCVHRGANRPAQLQKRQENVAQQVDSNPDCSYTLTTAVSLTSYAILFTGKGHYLKHVQNVLLIRIAADKESTEMSKQVVFWARLS